MKRQPLYRSVNLKASRNEPNVRLRVPQPLLDEITRAARDNGRSRNSEILARMALSLDGDAAVSPAAGSQGR